MRAWVLRLLGVRRLVHVPPMEERKLVECFYLADESPLLRGVLYVLRRIEEEQKQTAGDEDSDDLTVLRAARRMGVVREIEEALLAMVDKANAAAGRNKQPRVSEVTREIRHG